MNSKRLERTEQAIEAYRARIDTRKPETYGFASMAAVPYAHIVAQLLERKRPKGAQITLAPNPKDIVSSLLVPLAFCAHCYRVDMGKLEQVPRRIDTEEDDGMVPTHHDCLPQHRSSFRSLHSRQLVLRAYHAPFLRNSPLSCTRRLPVLSRSSNTGLKNLRLPLTLFLVYSHLPSLPFLASSCPSRCAGSLDIKVL
jgi:hypothetical protein